MRVLFASSEAVPFAKTGGLGDVAGSLPRALKHAGAKAAVILPKYSTIPQEYQDRMKHVADFYVPLAWRNDYCGIEKLTLQGLDFYFVDNESYFKRDSLYGYFDDGERFAFFAKAVCEAIARVPELECDVLHCNDWQTALSCVFLREFYKGLPGYDNVKTVFSIHNVKFQGQYGDEVMSDICGLADTAAAGQMYTAPKTINFMKGALLYADTITTVSPTYAEELKTPFYGESGGQAGDTGVIKTDNATLEVTATGKTPDGVVLHIARFISGDSIALGDKVHAQIDVEKREATRRNHTAAHLLQAALVQVLGDHVHQAVFRSRHARCPLKRRRSSAQWLCSARSTAMSCALSARAISPLSCAAALMRTIPQSSVYSRSCPSPQLPRESDV